MAVMGHDRQRQQRISTYHRYWVILHGGAIRLDESRRIPRYHAVILLRALLDHGCTPTEPSASSRNAGHAKILEQDVDLHWSDQSSISRHPKAFDEECSVRR